MTSIFISSTYRDLVAYRHAVVKAIRSAGLESIEMETFNARPCDPQSVCYDEIGQADIFVGIYAHRYGYVPEGKSASITQLEYEHAQERGKPILCYEVDEDHPWSPAMVSQGKDRKRLADFKKMVRTRSTITQFTTPEDLAAKVMSGLTRELERQHAGQRVVLSASTGTEEVLKGIGVDPHALFAAQGEILKFYKGLKRGVKVKAGELRLWLLRHGGRLLEKPMRVTVQGVLQPYVLMHSGWWEDGVAEQRSPVRGLQEWLYHGLQEWAPSWGYAWPLNSPKALSRMPFHLGQIADDMCDEAESIPVYIAADKALQLSEAFREHPGGLRVEVTGLLGHRRHFCLQLATDPAQRDCDECPQEPECLIDTRFGGALDYCISVDPEVESHRIDVAGPAQFYSGYLWKCLVPKEWVRAPADATLKESFFVWEHTNFADADTRKFNLDSLQRKQEFLERRYGPMHLLQKSSVLVPGKPCLPSSRFYELLSRNIRTV